MVHRNHHAMLSVLRNRISRIGFSYICSNAVNALQQISITSVLILNSHLRLAFPSGIYLLRLPTKTLHKPVFTSIPVTYPAHITLLHLTTRKWRTNYEAPHCAISSSPLLPRP